MNAEASPHGYTRIWSLQDFNDMMNFRILTALLAGLLLLSCNASKRLTPAEPYELRMLDTMVVTAPSFPEPSYAEDIPDKLPEYKAATTRTFDLLHTRLEISFDWEEEAVEGKAVLSLRPYFFPTDHLVLDAKGFEVHAIHLENETALKYENDGAQLHIHLDQTYERTDTVEVFIEYTARPSASGGSMAITSDQGLFFINSDGADPNKPRQIWTQGETENNSRWFPTIDKPNERCTQELFITVADDFQTLSNGVLVSSTSNPDGTRTDYWKMDQPHAPYLFMMAIGEYAIVSDQWRDIPLEYYVEQEYEADAKAIFPYTPEMLEYFSNLLDYPFPWQKFSQVVVRDYVTGAMENTTAVVFGEFMYGKARELVDVRENERIVAHEMFHQWFGDLVTCESWANLTLNEGFANYSEYLWFEHKHGREEADYHLISEESDYQYNARNDAHPLIHYYHTDRGDMFDQHSYNKGGLVLHMLRYYLGDEAFFAGLKHYLVENAYSEVETDELRIAMEEVSGLDLNWFFDQWYFQKGHPVLDIQYDYDEDSGEVVVEIEQTQYELDFPAIFQFPVAIQIFLPDGEVQIEETWMRERKKEFRFEVNGKPQLVLFDPQRILLCERRENKTDEDYVQQYYLAPNVRDRLEAVQRLLNTEGPEVIQAVLTDGLDDSFWAIRMFALENSELGSIPLDKVAAMAKEDPHAHVRASSCLLLGDSGEAGYAPVLEKIADTDFSLITVATALNGLYAVAPERGLKKAESLENQESSLLTNVIAEIYLAEQDLAKMDFFRRQVEKTEDYASVYYLMGYLDLARIGGFDKLLEASDLFKDVASEGGHSLVKRFAAMRALNEVHVSLYEKAKESKDDTEKEKYQSADQTIIEKIEAIKALETNPELLGIYRTFPDPKAK